VGRLLGRYGEASACHRIFPGGREAGAKSAQKPSNSRAFSRRASASVKVIVQNSKGGSELPCGRLDVVCHSCEKGRVLLEPFMMQSGTSAGGMEMPSLALEEAAFVKRAVHLACEAVEHGNRPFAAVLVASDGEVLFEGSNVSVKSGDPFDHAEIHVLRSAIRKHGPARVAGAAIYVNGEPCTMCAGTILRYALGRVVYAVREQTLLRYLAQGNIKSYPSAPIFALAPDMTIVGGAFEAESLRPFEMYVERGQF
jgi:tRNA(Arg) A34 adenosine deaminase TadA